MTPRQTKSILKKSTHSVQSLESQTSDKTKEFEIRCLNFEGIQVDIRVTSDCDTHDEPNRFSLSAKVVGNNEIET